MPMHKFFILLGFIVFPGTCWADVVLLQSGNVLVNVHVDDRKGTETQALRVRFFPHSFEFRPGSNSVHLLSGYSNVYPVAEVVSTTTVYGKEDARKLISERAWERYIPPARVQVVTPRRDPPPQEITNETATTTAVPALMVNIIPPTVPLEIRVNRQVDLFLREQKLLVDALATSVTMGQISGEAAVDSRLSLLQYQKAILSRFFPAEPEVAKTLEQWDERTSHVLEKRRFPFEI